MRDLFNRSDLNPILPPEGTPWRKVYNPGAALGPDGVVHLFPRVVKMEEDWHSRIAHATSGDGERFSWDATFLLERDGDTERRGLEDPRITKVDGTYYMTFAAYDGTTVHLHTAIAKDLNGPWRRQGPALPDFDFVAGGGTMVHWVDGKVVPKTDSRRGTRWSKAGALFPRRIGAKFMLAFGEYTIWLASSEDGATFEAQARPLLAARAGTDYFDNAFVEMGPPPILTEKGWLMLYHGVSEAFRYQLGFVILDIEDPSIIRYRSDKPIFGPSAAYEFENPGMKTMLDVAPGGLAAIHAMSDAELDQLYKKAREENVLPSVTFCPGAVVRDGNLWLYYGAGDTSICTAWASLADILKLIP